MVFTYAVLMLIKFSCLFMSIRTGSDTILTYFTKQFQRTIPILLFFPSRAVFTTEALLALWCTAWLIGMVHRQCYTFRTGDIRDTERGRWHSQGYIHCNVLILDVSFVNINMTPTACQTSEIKVLFSTIYRSVNYRLTPKLHLKIEFWLRCRCHMSEWMSEWNEQVSEMSEWRIDWVSEWRNEWRSEWESEWNEWVKEWVSMSEWVSEWNEWVSELRHEWVSK